MKPITPRKEVVRRKQFGPRFVFRKFLANPERKEKS